MPQRGRDVRILTLLRHRLGIAVEPPIAGIRPYQALM